MSKRMPMVTRKESWCKKTMETFFGRPKKPTPGAPGGGGTTASPQDAGRPSSLHCPSANCDEEDSGGSMDHVVDYKDMVNNLDDRQIDDKFEEMLADMNLSEEKKKPLRVYDSAQKRKTLIAYKVVNSQEGRSKFEKPADYITYLSQPDLTVNKLTACLENLRISLTNNPLSWVEDFVDTGVPKLVSILSSCYVKDERYTRSQHECIKCLKAIMNNTVGIRAVFACPAAFPAIAKSVDPSKPHCMFEAVKVLAATCLIPNGHQKVLDAITISGDPSSGKRFYPVIQGLRNNVSESLKVACMQLLNAIINTPDDLDFRLHLRNEIMRIGFFDLIDDLRSTYTEGGMNIQITAFDGNAEDDHEEFINRFDSVRTDFDDINDCFELVKNLTMDTAAEPYLLSILQHLLFIRDDHLIRPAYYKLIEECITQIVLHKNGYDPDFRATARFNIDVKPLIDGLIEKSKAEDEPKMLKVKQQLEDALSAKQEAEAKTTHLEERIRQLQQPGTTSHLNPSSIAAIAKTIGGSPGGPPIPPPMPVVCLGVPAATGAPPPPPMPGMGMPPPPPPMMPGGPGIPPPPPMFGGAPPPPPMFGGPGGPPPPPMGMPGAPMMPRPDILPYGLKPKRKWEVEGGVALKRANWKTIVPQKMSEKSFWVRVQEESLASPDILTGLAKRFSSKPAVKKSEDSVDRMGTVKKVKDLKVLDGKAAQNISILLGGSLKHMSYSAVRQCIMRCDTKVLSATVLDLLIQYLPSPEQLKRLLEFKDSYKDLTEAEQFAVTIADIKRLLPRLKSLSFREHYKELIQEVKPDIVSGTAACEEIKKSAKFAKILELVLLLGNYMNTGSKNAGAFGFEMSFLTKLTATKDLENKHTLLHYLVSTIETKFPEVLTFAEEVPHADRAARVSIDNLQKSLKKMDSDIKNLETDLTNSKVPQDNEDQFYNVMLSFAEEARGQCNVLHSMLKKMEVLYADLAEFYAFDQAKYTLEDFFGDIKMFKDAFGNAHGENLAIKEAEEKAQRAKDARILAERERGERAQRHKQLVNMDAQQDGVMDSLMEALSSGSAFSRERQRKKGTRVAGAERRAQLSRSRSRSGLVGALSTRELSSEILGSA
ncbi:protein diaphanous-like isoform X2 [Arctopsyche grandis]|uniref:protein diaphanous-like isoform X2 n=1 Tax=Arctopsyche grandis TaxID=121162 RepID=UPI00406D9C9F